MLLPLQQDLGADEVKIVYRRRRDHMTALLEEIEGAEAEGCKLVTLQAPARVAANENGKVWLHFGLSLS